MHHHVKVVHHLKVLSVLIWKSRSYKAPFFHSSTRREKASRMLVFGTRDQLPTRGQKTSPTFLHLPYLFSAALRPSIHPYGYVDDGQDRQIRNRSLGTSSHRPIRSHHRIGIQDISSPLCSPPFIPASRAAIHSENVFIQEFSYSVTGRCTCSSSDQNTKESS